jgi:acyl carrier protein
MGLDSVELVMECEDEFQIRIADADASATETVGQLQTLCIRLVEEQTQTTLSQERRDAIR